MVKLRPNRRPVSRVQYRNKNLSCKNKYIKIKFKKGKRKRTSKILIGDIKALTFKRQGIAMVYMVCH